MDPAVALKLTAYAMAVAVVAVVLDGLTRRAMRRMAPPLSVVLPQAIVVTALGLAVFAVALPFVRHTWVLFGLPVLVMAGVHRLFRRRSGARAPAEQEPSGTETAATDGGNQPSALQTIVTSRSRSRLHSRFGTSSFRPSAFP